jgi:hypothetical protein
MNTDRFNLLLDVLRHVEPERFDMARWVRNPHTLVIEKGPDARPPFATCGTIACAAGHLALDPRAQTLGLRLENSITMPVYDNKCGYRALAAFLDITLPDAEYLFCPFEYNTATLRAVTMRIRRFMKERA